MKTRPVVRGLRFRKYLPPRCSRSPRRRRWITIVLTERAVAEDPCVHGPPIKRSPDELATSPCVTGPQGPGATSFATTLPNDSTSHTLITIDGLEIKGLCTMGAKIEINAGTPDGAHTMDISGTTVTAVGSTDTYKQLDAPATSGIILQLNASGAIDIGAIARNTTASSAFSRLDIHVDSTACNAWGMITPSTSS